MDRTRYVPRPSVQKYGPDCDLDETASTWRDMRPVNRVGNDYLPHLELPHLPKADYQAITDILRSHGDP